MTAFFFYGTLCHPPLLATVLGRSVGTRPARLPDHAVFWAAGHSFPVIEARPGAAAPGLLVEGLTGDEAARLDFYEGGFDYATRQVTVQTDAGPVDARVYVCPPGRWPLGAPWDLRDWAARWGGVVVAAAADYMAAMGQHSAAAVSARYPMLLARAASRLRAAAGGPTTLRHRAGPGDVTLHDRQTPYAKFFAVEEYDLSHRRFDGATEKVGRAVLVAPDAATVLPYDPARDRVLVIEQFRPGSYARGDAQPWLLEPVAGRVDPGETPEDAARREAGEEAGVTLGALHPIPGHYPSPGTLSEFLYAYIGIADLPDTAAGPGGKADEGEDIRAHVIAFDRLMDLVATGEACNGPLLLSALWLAQLRERLRRGAGFA